MLHQFLKIMVCQLKVLSKVNQEEDKTAELEYYHGGRFCTKRFFIKNIILDGVITNPVCLSIYS